MESIKISASNEVADEKEQKQLKQQKKKKEKGKQQKETSDCYGNSGYYGGFSGYGHTAPPYKGGYKNRGKGYDSYSSRYGQGHPGYHSAYKAPNDSAQPSSNYSYTSAYNSCKPSNYEQTLDFLKKREAKVMRDIANSFN